MALRLNDYTLSLAEAARLGGTSYEVARKRAFRGAGNLGRTTIAGRRVFSLLDACALEATETLMRTLRMGPTDAAEMASEVADHIALHCPKDGEGNPIARFGALTHAPALQLAFLDGVVRTGSAVALASAHIRVALSDVLEAVLQRLPEIAR